MESYVVTCTEHQATTCQQNPAESKYWDAHVIVHVKYLCICDQSADRRALHVVDPVDDSVLIGGVQNVIKTGMIHAMHGGPYCRCRGGSGEGKGPCVGGLLLSTVHQRDAALQHLEEFPDGNNNW